MAFLRSLLPRRRPRVQAASPVPALTTEAAAVSTAPEHGHSSPFAQRRYLEGVPYLLPTDPLEDQRLNEQHHALDRSLSNYSLAPLSSERG